MLSEFFDQHTLNVIVLGILTNPLFLLAREMIISSHVDTERDFDERINQYGELQVVFLVERGIKETLIKMAIPYSMVLDMFIVCYQADRFMIENPGADALDWMIVDVEQKVAKN